MVEFEKKLKRIEKLILSTQKNLLTIDEVCILTGISKSHIYKLTMRQEIPHYKQSKHLYFEREQIESWLKSNPVKSITQIEDDASEYLSMRGGKR